MNIFGSITPSIPLSIETPQNIDRSKVHTKDIHLSPSLRSPIPFSLVTPTNENTMVEETLNNHDETPEISRNSQHILTTSLSSDTPLDITTKDLLTHDLSIDFPPTKVKF